MICKTAKLLPEPDLPVQSDACRLNHEQALHPLFSKSLEARGFLDGRILQHVSCAAKIGKLTTTFRSLGFIRYRVFLRRRVQ
jgi:hypothetical protein